MTKVTIHQDIVRNPLSIVVCVLLFRRVPHKSEHQQKDSCCVNCNVLSTGFSHTQTHGITTPLTTWENSNGTLAVTQLSLFFSQKSVLLLCVVRLHIRIFFCADCLVLLHKDTYCRTAGNTGNFHLRPSKGLCSSCQQTLQLVFYVFPAFWVCNNSF